MDGTSLLQGRKAGQKDRMASSKLYKVDGAHKDSTWAVAWTPQGPDAEVQQLVTGSVDETVALWDVRDAADKDKENVSLNKVVGGHMLGALSVICHPTQPLAISSSMESKIRVIGLDDMAVKATLDVGPVECWTLAGSPDGSKFASGTHTGAVNVWDLATEKLEASLETHGGFALSVAYSANGKMLATGSKDGTVFIFDVGTHKLRHTITTHTMPVRSLCFAPDSSLLYVACDDLTVGIIDADAGTTVGCLRGHLGSVWSVATSPDRRLLATGSSDNTVKLWDLAEGKCVTTFEKSHVDQVYGVAFNADGSRLASVGGEGNLNVYMVASSS